MDLEATNYDGKQWTYYWVKKHSEGPASSKGSESFNTKKKKELIKAKMFCR